MLVLYHAFCIDGFTAAWAVWRKYGDAATYMPFNYNAPQQKIDRLLVKACGQDVMLVDFCFPPEVLSQLLSVAKSVHVIDHHETGKEWLEQHGPHERLKVNFRLDESGASLTWAVLHGRPLPKLVQYVRDRDLWLHELPHTKEVTAALNNTDFDFQVWDKLDIAALIRQGGVVLKHVQRLTEFHVPHRKLFVAIKDGVEYRGVSVCAPQYLKSDLALAIAEASNAPFGVVYQVEPLPNRRASITYSFRVPKKSDFNAAEFCSRFGGGGHVKAAAMKIEVAGAKLVDYMTKLDADNWSGK